MCGTSSSGKGLPVKNSTLHLVWHLACGGKLTLMIWDRWRKIVINLTRSVQPFEMFRFEQLIVRLTSVLNWNPQKKSFPWIYQRQSLLTTFRIDAWIHPTTSFRTWIHRERKKNTKCSHQNKKNTRGNVKEANLWKERMRQAVIRERSRWRRRSTRAAPWSMSMPPSLRRSFRCTSRPRPPVSSYGWKKERKERIRIVHWSVVEGNFN